MIRLAALLRKEGDFSIATAGFLNFSQPTFMDAVARCVHKGATEVFVQPYFLISGYYVKTGVPKLVAEARAAYPEVAFYLAEAFDDHPALLELTHKRIREADPDADAALLLAHGSPHEHANAPIFRVTEALSRHYPHAQLGFMEINTPTIADAAAASGTGGRKTHRRRAVLFTARWTRRRRPARGDQQSANPAPGGTFCARGLSVVRPAPTRGRQGAFGGGPAL